MGGMVVVGGWLNRLGIARADVLLALVLGVIILDALCEARTILRGGRRDRLPESVPVGSGSERDAWLWGLAVVALISFRYVASLGVIFSVGDDKSAYLSQVARLVETGSVGLDPFSSRQLFSLNGQSFLLGLMCSGSSLRFLHLLDPGVGWIVIGGTTWSIVRKELGRSTRHASVLTALVLMAGQPHDMNLSEHLTGAVLYLTVVRTAWRFAVDGALFARGPMVLLAISLAGLGSVKTTFFLFALLFAACWYGLRMLHSPPSRSWVKRL